MKPRQKKNVGLLLFSLPFLLSCSRYPETLESKEELKLVAGEYKCSFSEGTRLKLKTDFTCTFTFIDTEDKVIQRETTFELRQLAKDEYYGFGILMNPPENARVYRFIFQDQRIGDDAKDQDLSNLSCPCILTHYFEGPRAAKDPSFDLSGEVGSLPKRDGTMSPGIRWIPL